MPPSPDAPLAFFHSAKLSYGLGRPPLAAHTARKWSSMACAVGSWRPSRILSAVTRRSVMTDSRCSRTSPSSRFEHASDMVDPLSRVGAVASWTRPTHHPRRAGRTAMDFVLRGGIDRPASAPCYSLVALPARLEPDRPPRRRGRIPDAPDSPSASHQSRGDGVRPSRRTRSSRVGSVLLPRRAPSTTRTGPPATSARPHPGRALRAIRVAPVAR